MMKKIFAGCVFAACATFMVGCDKASSAASVASDKADKAKKEAEEKMSKMKDEVGKAIDVGALETKANTLTGDAKTAALAKISDLKKMFDDFKASTDITKMGELKDKLMKALDEVKKMLGM